MRACACTLAGYKITFLKVPLVLFSVVCAPMLVLHPCYCSLCNSSWRPSSPLLTHILASAKTKHPFFLPSFTVGQLGWGSRDRVLIYLNQSTSVYCDSMRCNAMPWWNIALMSSELYPILPAHEKRARQLFLLQQDLKHLQGRSVSQSACWSVGQFVCWRYFSSSVSSPHPQSDVCFLYKKRV